MSDLSPDAKEQRAARASVFRTARVSIGPSRRELLVRVRNISATGACIDHSGELTPGTVVRLAINKEPEIEGHIAWASGTLAGVAFGDRADHPSPDVPEAGPTAGWVADRPDPYRR